MLKPGFNLKAATNQFFDSKLVMSATDKAERRVLSRFGAFVRRTSRSSIRKRKKPSAPGKPPTNRIGTLKRLIFFTYDTLRKNVVIGPLQHGEGEGANALEEGGAVTIKVPEYETRNKVRRIRSVKRETVKIEKRPFMKPAFDKELPTVADQFSNSIR